MNRRRTALRSAVVLAAFVVQPAPTAQRGPAEGVVEALKLAPAQKVADIGAGAGRYSRPMARAVAPGGVVYAIDINRDVLARGEKTAAAEGITNITAVVAEENDPKVPEPVDLVFFSDSLHHIHDQPTYLKNLRKYLKPGGRIAVIDFAANWPRNDHIRRYTVEELDAWMKGAGFTREESHDIVRDHFFVIYR
jgi:ubiquinone/menaquinone biosynthesis C-methylase UbiE